MFLFIAIHLLLIINPSSAQPKQSCGTNMWCYVVDITPSTTQSITQQVTIQHEDDDAATNFFVYFRPQTRNCMNPTISLQFEVIDYNGNTEYLRVYNENNQFIRQCQGGLGNAANHADCGQFHRCLMDQTLGIPQINVGSHYRVRIYESAAVDALCSNGYSINARLSLKCDAISAPPPATTSPPVITSPPVTTASGGKRKCGTNPDSYCYDVGIYPLSQNTFTQTIQHGGGVDTDYYIDFTANGADCNNPSISLQFELIDYDSNAEYLQVFNTNNQIIQTCKGGAGSTRNHADCGKFGQCINDRSLGIAQINKDTSYRIRIFQPAAVGAICDNTSPFAINARLSLKCNAASPQTPQPTRNPVSTPSPVAVPSGCGRHRKEWSTLTDAEQLLYINGFKQLADGGTIQTMSRLHGTAFHDIHYVAQFFPWHRKFLFDLESAIRNLGGQYSCFSMPYWDWSNEPTPSDGIEPQLLYKQNGGGMGGDSNGGCISSGPFRSGSYTPESGNCLVRQISYYSDAQCSFHSPESVMDSIDKTNVYASFRGDFEYAPHSRAHVCIGGAMASANSPDDPWFYLHHNFVDYVWALWQDCNNYDGVPINQVTSNMYYGNKYATLDGLGVTAGSTLDITSMGYSFEKGPFWDNARVDAMDNCGAASDPVNPSWFKDTTRRRLKGGKEDKGNKKDSRDTANKIRDELEKQGYSKKELVHLTAIKVCEWEQEKEGNVCLMPESFEDCSDLPLNVETNDIDITLEELLNKQGLTECMKETRIKTYEWAKVTRSLLGLCDGCYDRFCDKGDTLRRKCQIDGDSKFDDDKRKKENKKNKGSAANVEPFKPAMNWNDIEDKNNNKGVEGWMDNIFAYIYRYKYGIIVGVLMGSMVIAIFMCYCCCYCVKSKKYKKINNNNNSHQYGIVIKDIDSENDELM